MAEQWHRLTPGTESASDVVIARAVFAGLWCIADGFQDQGELRRYPHGRAVLLDAKELARLLELVRESAE